MTAHGDRAIRPITQAWHARVSLPLQRRTRVLARRHCQLAPTVTTRPPACHSLALQASTHRCPHAGSARWRCPMPTHRRDYASVLLKADAGDASPWVKPRGDDARCAKRTQTQGELQGASSRDHARRFKTGATLKAGNDCDACSLRNGARSRPCMRFHLSTCKQRRQRGECYMTNASARLSGGLEGQLHDEGERSNLARSGRSGRPPEAVICRGHGVPTQRMIRCHWQNCVARRTHST